MSDDDKFKTHCDICDRFTMCSYVRDPYVSDVHDDSSDETNPKRWMCDDCLDNKKDDI